MFIFISINIHIQKMIPCKIHLTVHISGSENILQTKHFHEKELLTTYMKYYNMWR